MNSSFWASLYSLRDAVDQASISAARRLQEVRESGEPGTPVSGVVLSHLHLELRHQLEGWASFVLMPSCVLLASESDAPRCLRLVSFWLNERVCSHLDPEDKGDYVPVGPADVNLQAGGVLFFEEVERLFLQRLGAVSSGFSATRESALGLSCDLALFILEQGFSGMHSGDLTQLEAFKLRLRHGTLPSIVEKAVEEQTLPRKNGQRLLALGAVVLSFYACSAWLSQGLGGM